MIVGEIIDVKRHNKIKDLKRIQQMTAMSQAMGNLDAGKLSVK